jgi:hypothetical protein
MAIGISKIIALCRLKKEHKKGCQSGQPFLKRELSKL